MTGEKAEGTSYGSGVALVAGGSGGLGAAICRALARAGSDVALTYHRNKDAAEAVAGDVRAAGRRAAVTQVDLTDQARVLRFVTDAAAEFGPVHTAVYA